MAAQSYDQCFHAILKLLSNGDIYSMQDIEQACRDYDDPADSNPAYNADEDNQFKSKVYWSICYLKAAGLIESKPRSGLFELTDEGIIAAKNPKQINERTLYRYKGFFESQVKNIIEQIFPNSTSQELLDLFIEAVKNECHRLAQVKTYIQDKLNVTPADKDIKRCDKLFYSLRDRLFATGQLKEINRVSFCMSEENYTNQQVELSPGSFQMPRDSDIGRVIISLLCDNAEHSFDEIVNFCANKFKLTEENLRARYPKSGELVFRKNVNWKLSHMKSDGDIVSTGRSMYKIAENFDPNAYSLKHQIRRRTRGKNSFGSKVILKILLNKEVKISDIEDFAAVLSRKRLEQGIIATNTKISQEVKNFAENIESSRIIILDKSQIDEINVEFQ